MDYSLFFLKKMFAYIATLSGQFNIIHTGRQALDIKNKPTGKPCAVNVHYPPGCII